MASQNDSVTEFDGEVRASSRERKPTEKFENYERHQAETQFKNAVSVWHRKANYSEIVIADTDDIELLRHERSIILQQMEIVSATYDHLAQVSLGCAAEEMSTKFDKVEIDNRELLKNLNDKIKEFRTDLCETSSISSVVSRTSQASVSSSRADAAAEAAALKVQLEYMDVETQKKIELDKLETNKRLDMAEARLKAIIDCEDGAHTCISAVDTNRVQQSLTSPANSATQGTANEFTQPHIPQPVNTTQGQSNNFECLATKLVQQISLSRLPTPEPAIFYGNPLEFPAWDSAFQALIEVKRIPATEIFHYLIKYLGGDAKETIQGYSFVASTTAYDEAKALLVERFGNKFVIANAFRNKLDLWPKIMSRDGIALRKYADFLRQCDAAQGHNNSLNILNDEHENHKMVQKLPEWVVTRWARVAAERAGGMLGDIHCSGTSCTLLLPKQISHVIQSPHFSRLNQLGRLMFKVYLPIE